MKVYSVAMTEVQDDCVMSDSAVCRTWEAAEDMARNFMKRCVHDYYQLDCDHDVADPEAESWERLNRRLVWDDTKDPKGMRRLELHYDDADLTGMIVLAACIKEVEMGKPVAVLVKGQFTEYYSPFYHDPVYGISEDDVNSEAAQALSDEGITGPTLGDYMLCDDVGWLAERQCSEIAGSYPEWERETNYLIVQIEAAFIQDKPRTYHSDRCGDFEIIPYHAEDMPQLSEKSLKFYAGLGYGEKLKEAVEKMLKGDRKVSLRGDPL